MRLWSLHPKYLDAKGLTACWREALLARRVLSGGTKGYRHHPQLERFRLQPDPLAAIDSYLRAIYAESVRRGYRFDAEKARVCALHPQIGVTAGQLAYERTHLLRKLAARDTERFMQLQQAAACEPHPLFRCVPGGVENWERQ